ncbi:IscS subfamily cysteine desulfurase [Alcaligenes sp. CHO6]|uniref:IscS subfamily cysteine desulfurase n=1 Tax=Alcaligenes sp. CHO6 TaxID=3123298 RepID=UPI00265B285D|nr:IscS subfamily cysteine desulfurase [Alcaligenes faecalis]
MSRAQRIYMDYAATTPVDPRVADSMIPWLTERFGNPASSSHPYGWDAEEAVDQARRQVASLIGAEPREIVWTSGATEAINLALKGAAQFYQAKGRHIITFRTEHKAVLDTCLALQDEGFEITFLDVLPNGLIDPQVFAQAIRPDTILASVMLVNNEIGVIQDVQALGAVCREHKVLFHVDAAQATGKVAINVQEWPVDLMSMSAHKTYGPKGIGALYVRRKPAVRLKAQIHGGGHERGFRSGTLATHQIVGMGRAFELAAQEMDQDNQRITALRDRLWAGLQSIPDLYLNGSLEQRVPHNLNISVDHIEGEALMMALTELAVSSGSACTSASLEPSYVLTALGRSDQLAHSSLRLSLGRFTTEQEVDDTIAAIARVVEQLRAISPLWDESASEPCAQ